MTRLMLLATWPWQLLALAVRLHVEHSDRRAVACLAELETPPCV